MALRDQPYLPLYIQDFLTDEKLIMCSAATTGVYIRLMCLMHKSASYGSVLLRQNFKQNTCQILNFATQLTRQMPYDLTTIKQGLEELINEGVIFVENDKITQKRMVRDSYISELRKNAGKKGGFAKAKSVAKDIAKDVANSENEYEYSSLNNTVIEEVVVTKDTTKGKNKKFIPPSVKDVIAYFDEKGYTEEYARHVHEYYSTGNWTDTTGAPVKNWKQKCLQNWLKGKDGLKPTSQKYRSKIHELTSRGYQEV